MSEYDHEDNREMDEIPPSEPVGSLKVEFGIPVPTVEQIAGQVARQVIAVGKYGAVKESALHQLAEERLADAIDAIIAERARAVVEDLLAKPVQPTDAFGNPKGEPTTLQAVLARRIEGWCLDPVNREGKVANGDRWSGASLSRLEWLVGQIVDHRMAEMVKAEVGRLANEMKAQATTAIAKQIAERVAGMVFR